MVPVSWWTGKAEMNFEKLKGHGRTADDPLTMEPRESASWTILHAMHSPGLALCLFIIVWQNHAAQCSCAEMLIHCQSVRRLQNHF